MKAKESTEKSSMEKGTDKVELRTPKFILASELPLSVDCSDPTVQMEVLECAIPASVISDDCPDSISSEETVESLFFLEEFGSCRVIESDSPDSDMLTDVLDSDYQIDNGYSRIMMWRTLKRPSIKDRCNSVGIHSSLLSPNKPDDMRDYLVNNLKAQKEAFLKRIAGQWDGIEERAITALVEHLLKTGKVVISE